MQKLAIAIDNTPEIKGHAKVGKSAIKNEYRLKVVVPNPKLLTCSVDIDSAVHSLYPNANRWDYALEYGEDVFFLEFHPAETSEVGKVLAKLDWLKVWLKTKAPDIQKIATTNYMPYYWIGSGSFNILKTSSQYRRLATAHLLPKSEWNYNKLPRMNSSEKPRMIDSAPKRRFKHI